MTKRTADEEADRLERLLDLGIAEARKGDWGSALMMVKEALGSAERLPKKSDVICLPDRSKDQP